MEKNHNKQQNKNTEKQTNQFDNLIKQLQKTSFNQNNHKIKKTINNQKILLHPSTPQSLSLDWATLVEAASKEDAEEEQLPDLTEWEKESQLHHLTTSLELQSRTELIDSSPHQKLQTHSSPIRVKLNSPSPSPSLSSIREDHHQLDHSSTSTTINQSVDSPSTQKVKPPTLLDSIHRPASSSIAQNITTNTIPTSSVRNKFLLNKQQKQSIAKLIIRPNPQPSVPSTSTSTSITTMSTTITKSSLIPSSSNSSTLDSTKKEDDDHSLNLKSTLSQLVHHHHHSDSVTLTDSTLPLSSASIPSFETFLDPSPSPPSILNKNNDTPLQKHPKKKKRPVRSRRSDVDDRQDIYSSSIHPKLDKQEVAPAKANQSDSFIHHPSGEERDFHNNNSGSQIISKDGLVDDNSSRRRNQDDTSVHHATIGRNSNDQDTNQQGEELKSKSNSMKTKKRTKKKKNEQDDQPVVMLVNKKNHDTNNNVKSTSLDHHNSTAIHNNISKVNSLQHPNHIRKNNLFNSSSSNFNLFDKLTHGAFT